MKDFKKEAQTFIDAHASWFTDISDQVWGFAELSLKEFKSTELYCQKLRELGFAVTENLGGIRTSFCGAWGSGHPVIGILGEFDALDGLSQKPGLAEPDPLIPGASGHGCGHNLLGAGSLAAAAAVKKYLEDTGKPGTVIFYGCPGEEGGAGKAFLAREGVWKQLDAAVSWHPGSANQVTSGSNTSSIQVLYKFKGIPAHAAGNPHVGRSALDAVEVMNIGVQFLREHMTPDCRIHYAITDTGGISPNVVQSSAAVLYMVRSNRVAEAVKLLARVDNIAKGAALITETSYDRVFIDGTADVLPNYTLEKLLFANMEATELPVYTAEDWALAEALKKTYPSGGIKGLDVCYDEAVKEKILALSDNGRRAINDFLCPHFSCEEHFPGSTDVGDVSWLAPTAQISAVCWPSGVPGHSWQVVTCGKTALAHKGMLYASKVLAGAVIDLLNDPETLAAAKAEFEKRSASGYVCPIEPDAVPTAL